MTVNSKLSRRDCLKRASVAAASLPFVGCTANVRKTGSKAKPNIVFILADDLGYGDVSCMSPESKIKTPNIDAIAESGMKFTDAHSNSAVCTPTRYGVLTGRYSFRSSLKSGALWGYSSNLIEPERATVPSFLKTHGYHSGCVGKWHLGFDWGLKDGSKKSDAKNVDFTKPITNGPLSIGFDYFFGIPASLDMDPYVYIENNDITAAPEGRRTPGSKSPAFWRAGPIGPDFDFVGVLPNLTEKATQYIDERAKADKPFFLYFPLPAPHTPIVPTGEFKGKSKMNSYADFVMQTDHTVGEVLKALKRNGIADNTLIIFTSDNGCSPQANYKELEQFDHDPSYIYRGHKADIYEGGHRVAYVAAWPVVVKGNSKTDQTVCLTDLYATAADILGVKLDDSEAVDSVSFLPAIKGKAKKPIREATVHHSVNGSFSIRQGKWKLEMCPGSGGWSAPMPGKAGEDAPPVQLYDLKNDIAEKKNLFNEQPAVADRLMKLLYKYAKTGRSTPGASQPNDGEVDILRGIPKKHKESIKKRLEN